MGLSCFRPAAGTPPGPTPRTSNRCLNPLTTTITIRGQALRGLVATIYNEGRSQIGHGGRPSLLKELPIRVDTAIIFAAHVLARYIEGLSRYDCPERYESYLSALPSVFTLPA